MNINKENIADFRDKYDLAQFANTEEFMFEGSMVMMEYAASVLTYFDQLKESGIDEKWLERLFELNNKIQNMRTMDVNNLAFVFSKIDGVDRLVVAEKTAEGLTPLFIDVDDELMDEIIG